MGTVLLAHSPTLSLFYAPTLLLFYFSTFLHFYFSTFLLFYISTFLLLYSSTSLLLYCSTSLLLYFSISLPLYFSISLLLYFSTWSCRVGEYWRLSNSTTLQKIHYANNLMNIQLYNSTEKKSSLVNFFGVETSFLKLKVCLFSVEL